MLPKAEVRSDPYWKAQFIRLKKQMHVNKAIVSIARRWLVSIWHILNKREPYRHFDEETIAYKMLIWAQAIGEEARQDLRAMVTSYHPSLSPMLLPRDQAMAGYDPFSP